MADAEHDIRGITFRNVRLAGERSVEDTSALPVRCNEFVRDVHIEAARK